MRAKAKILRFLGLFTVLLFLGGFLLLREILAADGNPIVVTPGQEASPVVPKEEEEEELTNTTQTRSRRVVDAELKKVELVLSEALPLFMLPILEEDSSRKPSQ